MIPDAVTLFAMEQNLLSEHQRRLRFKCGCLVRARYLKSWDGERWLTVVTHEIGRCSEHKRVVPPGDTPAAKLYLTEELVEFNQKLVLRPEPHRWSAVLSKAPHDP